MKKEKYLEEDKDLLNEIDDMNIKMSPEVYSQEKRMRILQEIQIKSILRSRKTNSDMDKSTTRFSFVLIFVGLIQVAIAIVQFLLVTTSNPYFTGWKSVIPIIFIFIVIFMVYKAIKKLMIEYNLFPSKKTTHDQKG